MKVYQAIEALQKCDPMLELVVDTDPPVPLQDKSIWYFNEITEIEEVETDRKEKMAAIFVKRVIPFSNN